MKEQVNKQSQKYIEIINNLSESSLEIIAVSLWPHEMKKLLLNAPMEVQEAIIEDVLMDTEVIDSLSEDALEKIGHAALSDEIKSMLLCAPLDLQKSIVDGHLEEQERISNL